MSTAIKRTHFTELESQGYSRASDFRCQILVLSAIRGQRTEAPWTSACARVFSFFLASIFEIGKWILRLGVQRVSKGHNPSCGICMLGVAQVCTAPQNNVKSRHWSNKDHNGRLLAMARTIITRTRTCHNLECLPQTHVELSTLKSTLRFQMLMLERKQTCECAQNSKALRYVGLRFYREGGLKKTGV